MNVDAILKSQLKGLDEDLLEYVTSIIGELTIEEKVVLSYQFISL